jgi:hypothetical protein
MARTEPHLPDNGSSQLMPDRVMWPVESFGVEGGKFASRWGQILIFG